MGKLKGKADWKDEFVKGGLIGSLLWVIISFVLIFRTAYSNYFTANMKPIINAQFYSFNYWSTLAILLVGLFLVFGALSLVFYRIKRWKKW